MLINLSKLSITFYTCRYFCTSRMLPATCKVAVCQMTSSNNKAQNLDVVKRLVTEAAREDAAVIFLPEACDYIGENATESKAMSEPLQGPVMTAYKQLAKDLKVWLSIGGFHECVSGDGEEQKVYNSHVLINSSGDIKATYRKIHLFDVAIPDRNIYLKESEVTKSGSDVVPPVNTPAGCLGLSICYDLRFPELSILQRKQGADILTFPSAFTYATGLVHWEILLRARAIENQCYVIAAAQYGKHNSKRISFGQSMIVDPWGKVIAECPKFSDEGGDHNESVAFATIDHKYLSKVRLEMPVLQHRRSDVYRLDLVEKEHFQIDDADTFSFADKIVPGATVFYRTRFSFAFTNIRCVVPGHVLVSSIKLARRLQDLTDEEVSDLFKTAVKVKKVMETVVSSTSTTVCVQDGKDAGQTVPHVHIHILPRKPNDFQRNDDIYEELAKHDREDSKTPVRSLEEMSEEAKSLRPYFI